MGRPAARVFDATAHGTPLSPGPGSPDVWIGFKPAWRGIPLAAAGALQAAQTAANAAMKVAEGVTKAAAGTPGGPAAYAAEQALKTTLAGTMGSAMSAFGGMSDIHICPVPVPVPPHGPGVVIDGSPTVLINHMPACREGDTVLEALGGPDKIVMGFKKVLIGDSGSGGAGGGGAGQMGSAVDEGHPMLDGIQTTLDVVGLIPGFGEVADGANALISLARGDYEGAALSAAAMIPLAGSAATATKFAKRAQKLAKAKERAESARHLKKARAILKETKPDLTPAERAKMLRAFEGEGFRVREVSVPEKRYRYYDGVNAKAEGGWSTKQKIDSPAERIEKLALPNNKADKVAEVELQPGATVFEGKVAKQKLKDGTVLNGGGDQTLQARGPFSKIKPQQ